MHQYEKGIKMNYQISGIDPTPFQHFFSMSDTELANHGISRSVADESPGYPCRVSLEDAGVGEELLLLSYAHQTAHSPYRANGPIYVRKNAVTQAVLANEVPQSFRLRLLSVRAYDYAHFMVDAEVIEGVELESVIAKFFINKQVAYLHVHNARRGCYAGRVDRA
jgi:Protein of unknown function (DUF1203)